MALTTTERITVEGIDLKTYCWNVETLGATLRSPSRRGANAVVAGRSGGILTRFKPHEEATYVWPMWVLGADADGSIPGGSTARIEFFKRVDELTRLFSKEHGALDVRHTLPDGTIRQAFLECRSVLDFTTGGIGQPMGKVAVELVNPSCYWQDINTTSVTDNTSALTVDFGAGGTAPIEDAVITLTGTINNPVFTDAFAGDALCSYAKTVGAGHSLVINSSLSTVTASGGHTLDMTKFSMQNTNGRLMRFVPHPVSGGYRLVVTGTGFSGATVNVVSRRKFLVG